MPSAREALERGRVQSGLGIQDLWLRCFELGFNESARILGAIFAGTETPSRGDYDLIAHCLNERLTELGEGTLVPYCDELDI